MSIALLLCTDMDRTLLPNGVLPRQATKLHALEFLQANLGLAVEQCLFAGDSGNDHPVLVSPIPAVLVANAMPEVAAEAEAGATALGNRDVFVL